MDCGPICGLVLRRTTSPPPKLELEGRNSNYSVIQHLKQTKCISSSAAQDVFVCFKLTYTKHQRSSTITHYTNLTLTSTSLKILRQLLALEFFYSVTNATISTDIHSRRWTDLVVDYHVYRSMCFICRQVTEVKRLVHNSLSRECRITMKQQAHHLTIAIHNIIK